MANNTTWGATVGQERFLLPFLMDRPDINETLFEVYGAQGRPEFQILRTMGMQRAVQRNTGTYFIRERMRPIVHTAGNLTVVVAPSATAKAQYSFVLSTTSGSDDTIVGAVAPDFPQFGSTNYYYAPVVQGMGLIFPAFDDSKTGTVISVTETAPDNFVVLFEMDQIGVTAGALTTTSYVDGTPIVLSSSAYAPGSTYPSGLFEGVTKDSWTLQNIWTAWEIDGEALTNMTWVKDTSMGMTVSGWRTIGQSFNEFLHAQRIDDALWDGPGQINPLLAATNTGNQNVVLKTEGVIPYARRKGTELTWPIGMLTPQWFDFIDDVVTQNYGPKYFMGCTSASFSREFSWAMIDFFKRTQLNLVAAEAEKSLFSQIPGTGKHMKTDFDYLTHNQRTYCLSPFYRFDDPNGLGATGYYGKNFAFFCPIGTKTDPKNSDNKIPYFGFYYKAKGGYSRLDEVSSLFGATNGQHTQNVDKNSFVIKSQVGSAHVGGENMIVCDGQ